MKCSVLLWIFNASLFSPIIATGDQESIELSSNDVPHQNTIEAEVTTSHLDVDEHRENVLAASTSQSCTGEMVVIIDPNEDEEQEVDGAIMSEAQEAAVPEKLQDEDQFAEIWYKRWFFTVFPLLRRGAWMSGHISNFTKILEIGLGSM